MPNNGPIRIRVSSSSSAQIRFVDGASMCEIVCGERWCALKSVTLCVDSDVELCDTGNMTRINLFVKISFLVFAIILVVIPECSSVLSDKRLCYDPKCSGNWSHT